MWTLPFLWECRTAVGLTFPRTTVYRIRGCGPRSDHGSLSTGRRPHTVLIIRSHLRCAVGVRDPVTRDHGLQRRRSAGSRRWARSFFSRVDTQSAHRSRTVLGGENTQPVHIYSAGSGMGIARFDTEQTVSQQAGLPWWIFLDAFVSSSSSSLGVQWWQPPHLLSFRLPHFRRRARPTLFPRGGRKFGSAKTNRARSMISFNVIAPRCYRRKVGMGRRA